MTFMSVLLNTDKFYNICMIFSTVKIIFLLDIVSNLSGVLWFFILDYETVLSKFNPLKSGIFSL